MPSCPHWDLYLDNEGALGLCEPRVDVFIVCGDSGRETLL